jgi:hypothetical protein
MLDFDQFHRDTLPALLAGGRSALLTGRSLPAMGIALEDGGDGYTYRADGSDVTIETGTDGASFSVTLTHRDWSGLVNDLESVPAILYGGRLVAHRGDTMQFVRWEPALRALYTGRPLYQPGRFELRAESGEPLDPLAVFDLQSGDDDMRGFLDAAGYLLVKGVFDGDEIDAFRRGAAELAGAAVEGDQLSWWGRTDRGEPVLCRCINAGTLSAFSGLYEDERIRRLAGLLPEGMLHPAPADTDGVTVVYKNPGVAEGLADLPWHRDCGMGGHAVMCPTFVFSIYLYDATREQGPLQFLPGSHRFAYGFADAGEADMPGSVTVPATAGDVTIHVGDVMHAAPPPTAQRGPFRQSVLLSYHPRFTHHRGERHYNDVLLGAEDGQVSHLRALVGEDQAD